MSHDPEEKEGSNHTSFVLHFRSGQRYGLPHGPCSGLWSLAIPQEKDEETDRGGEHPILCLRSCAKLATSFEMGDTPAEQKL